MLHVAQQIDAVCASTGFLGITGHRIDQSIIDDMFATTTSFFERDFEAKMEFHLDDAAANRGYAPLGSEALSYSLGVESPPDQFEAFNIGRETPPAQASRDECATYFSPNVWPDDHFRATWLTYWDACEQLGLDLVDMFALALDLPDGYFQPFVDASPSVMRANWYNRYEHAAPLEDGQLRMGAHSDYGSLTILAADSVPGLQIRDTECSLRLAPSRNSSCTSPHPNFGFMGAASNPIHSATGIAISISLNQRARGVQHGRRRQ